MVIASFLCWTPFHAQRLGYVYFKDAVFFRTLNEYLYYTSGFLYYLSATVNPILYNLMSLKYRHAFRQTLCGKKRRRRNGNGAGGQNGPSRRSRGDGPSGGGGGGQVTTAGNGAATNINRSYTFRSTTRTGESGESDKDCTVIKAERLVLSFFESVTLFSLIL